MDCSLPGSSIPGIFQAGVLEWVPLPSPGYTAGLIKKQATWHSLASFSFHPVKAEFAEATLPPTSAFMNSAVEHILTCFCSLLYLTWFQTEQKEEMSFIWNNVIIEGNVVFIFKNLYKCLYLRSTAGIQYYVSFRCKIQWFSYIHVFSFRFLSLISYYRALTIVPCIVKQGLACWLSLFYVCMC